VLATLAGGAVALVAFVAVERRRGAEAMMPLALFDSRTFVGVTLLTLFLYGALNGLVVLLPYLLIRIAHYPAPAAGAALLPLPIVMGVGSRTVGRLAERTGPRLPLTIGPLIVAIGFVLGRRLGPGHFGYWSDVFPVAFTFAVGMTLSVAPLTATVLAAVDRQHAGSASGVNDATAYVAGLIVTALLGLVLVAAGSVGTFMPRFHVAMVAGAMLALAATASARLFIS
jgi:predicted MFS family arabinose efflux permease